jgi:hypothetical protein
VRRPCRARHKLALLLLLLRLLALILLLLLLLALILLLLAAACAALLSLVRLRRHARPPSAVPRPRALALPLLLRLGHVPAAALLALTGGLRLRARLFYTPTLRCNVLCLLVRERVKEAACKHRVCNAGWR